MANQFNKEHQETSHQIVPESASGGKAVVLDADNVGGQKYYNGATGVDIGSWGISRGSVVRFDTRIKIVCHQEREGTAMLAASQRSCFQSRQQPFP